MLKHLVRLPSAARIALLRKKLQGDLQINELLHILLAINQCKQYHPKAWGKVKHWLLGGLVGLVFMLITYIFSLVMLSKVIFGLIILYTFLALLWFYILDKFNLCYQITDFLVPILLALREDIHPNQFVKIQLNFSYSISRRFRTKVDKNYKILAHKVVKMICLALLLSTIFTLYVVLGKYLVILLALFAPITLVFFFLFIGYLWLLEIAIGKRAKIKNTYYQIPRISLRAKLVDQTFININVQHQLVKKQRFRKKPKYKKFSVIQKKTKLKSKTITHTQITFPHQKYGLSSEQYFEHVFHEKAPLISLLHAKKKAGEKKSSIIFKENTSAIVSRSNAILFALPHSYQVLKMIGQAMYRRTFGRKSKS